MPRPRYSSSNPFTDHTVGEPNALRGWNGNGAVRLFPTTTPSRVRCCSERLDADRPLAIVPDDLAALGILSELLARLSEVPAPAGIRRLSDFGAGLLGRVPRGLMLERDPSQHGLIRACASAVEEVLPEAGDRLVHEDLHFSDTSWRHTRPTSESPGWPSTPTRWPAIPASRSSRHCTTGGRKPSPPATYRGRSAAAST